MQCTRSVALLLTKGIKSKRVRQQIGLEIVCSRSVGSHPGILVLGECDLPPVSEREDGRNATPRVCIRGNRGDSAHYTAFIMS